MPEEITVTVVKYPDRANLVMRYVDPATGKQIARSTGTAKHREAVKVAAKWEAELREGRYQRTSRMGWDEFRQQYEDAMKDSHRRSTVLNYASCLNAFERHCRPERVGDLTTARINAFVAEMRKPQKRRDRKGKVVAQYNVSESSIARHLRHLKAVANWAHKQGLLPQVPQFTMPKRAATAKMKGRPLSGEEFERMLAAIPKALELRPTVGVQHDIVGPWKLLLRGLWATGLRLGEAMALRWDHQPGGVSVDLDGKQSVLIFDAESQKSCRAELVPLAPEAVELLTPLQRPRGYVFNLRSKRGLPLARHALKVGKLISKIGDKANVVTDPATGRTATAHDLRRAFAARWSKRVMPAVLKEIMRHADIQTTMTYYVRQNARLTANELWSAAGNISGNTEQKSKHTPEDSNLQPSDS